MSLYTESSGEKVDKGFQLLLAGTVKELKLLEPTALQPEALLKGQGFGLWL